VLSQRSGGPPLPARGRSCPPAGTAGRSCSGPPPRASSRPRSDVGARALDESRQRHGGAGRHCRPPSGM